eukprot:7717211-Pyramimonas_sp.AAC.1
MVDSFSRICEESSDVPDRRESAAIGRTHSRHTTHTHVQRATHFGLALGSGGRTWRGMPSAQTPVPPRKRCVCKRHERVTSAADFSEGGSGKEANGERVLAACFPSEQGLTRGHMAFIKNRRAN